MYITQIKNRFKQTTNIKKDYKKQILDHNIKKFNLKVKNNIDMFFSTKKLAQTKKNSVLQVNSVRDVKKMGRELKQHIEKNERIRLRHNRLSYNYWYLVETVANKADIPKFINTLAVFIKYKRAKAKGIKNTGDKQHKEVNSSWARKYPIQVHACITTWKVKSDNGEQMQYKRQAMRYTFE